MNNLKTSELLTIIDNLRNEITDLKKELADEKVGKKTIDYLNSQADKILKLEEANRELEKRNEQLYNHSRKVLDELQKTFDNYKEILQEKINLEIKNKQLTDHNQILRCECSCEKIPKFICEKICERRG